jgi:hypothetical protein
MQSTSELHRLFIALAFFGLTCVAAPAQVQPPAKENSGPPTAAKPILVVVPDAGVEPVAGGIRFNFGAVDRLVAPVVQHTFTLKNTGSESFVIDHIQPSCGCTSTLLGTEGKGDQNYTLMPNGEVAFQISLDLTHQAAGKVTKYLWVYKKGAAVPPLVVELDARVDAAVSFSPPVLDFGHNAAGVPRSLPLLVSVDKRLAAAGIPFELVCSNPGIKITPRDVEITGDQGNAKSLLKAYTVTLTPDATLGLLTGTVSMMVTPPAPGTEAKSQGAIRKETAAILLTTTFASLNGEVNGSVAASPGAAVFGVVNAGSALPRTLTLTGRSEQALKNLKIAPVTNWIAARFLPLQKRGKSEPDTAPPTRLLEISLTPKAPLGSIETQLIVTTEEGKRLVIPVMATINKN